jgi:nitroreductase
MEKTIVDPVLSRTSCRVYTNQPVEEAKIRLLISAGMSAPSAEDERPWHFIVVRDPAIQQQLSTISVYTHIVAKAPLAIVVCGDEALQKQQGCCVLDCAAATENILLEAILIGLGSVWLGVYPIEGRIRKARSILGVPGNIIPFSIVTAGYPAEHKMPVPRYDERRVHLQRWNARG